MGEGEGVTGCLEIGGITRGRPRQTGKRTGGHPGGRPRSNQQAQELCQVKSHRPTLASSWDLLASWDQLGSADADGESTDNQHRRTVNPPTISSRQTTEWPARLVRSLRTPPIFTPTPLL